jgi:hypothetical protein
MPEKNTHKSASLLLACLERRSSARAQPEAADAVQPWQKA